jgi:hypothetical protein
MKWAKTAGEVFHYSKVAQQCLRAGVVALASGLVLLISWWQDRAAWAAFWWGVASCGIGSGITMLALNAIIPFSVSHVVGPQIINLSAAPTLAATRIFNVGSVVRLGADLVSATSPGSIFVYLWWLEGRFYEPFPSRGAS